MDINMGKPIIQFNNINKKFGGIHAVKDVSFHIDTGEVHTVIGENGAGKSTLMNMLSGIYQPDGGEIIYKGKKVHITSPLVAKNYGIATVFQELKLCQNLTVVENIFLGREYRKHGGMDWQRMIKDSQEELEKLGMEIDVRSMVGDLSAAQMQLVEIAKAMFVKSDVLILDEPTSSLTYHETEKLFNIIDQLVAEGVAIIFISHRMEEVFRISDKISIMRNGEYLGTYKKEETTPEEIVSLISNKDVGEVKNHTVQRKKKTYKKGDKIAMSVRNLSRGNRVKNISFDLYEGEMLGFYGLEGSGRTELMETIFGLEKAQKGEIALYGGEPVHIRNPKEAMSHGIAMLPEDRKHVGLFMNFDIVNNITSVHDKDIKSTGTRLISKKKTLKLGKDAIEKLNIRARSPKQMVIDLSGGNQQKVVIAKCLSIDPKILIMDEPTRGVDVGAKSEIFDILHSLTDDTEKPKSVIIISSELEEVVNECDRVIIIKNGMIVGELIGEEIGGEKILQYAFNG